MLKFGNNRKSEVPQTDPNNKGKGGRKSTLSQQLQLSQKDLSAIKLQCMVRRYLARRRIAQQSQSIWIRVYDPIYKKYFWYNRLNQSSTWNQPRFSPIYSQHDHQAALAIQCLVRIFLAKCRMLQKLNQRFQRFFDFDNGKFYYLDLKTQKTFFNASSWLQRQKIQMSKEDTQLYQSYLRIKELEKKLTEKEKEIKEVRKKRVDELMPAVIQDKVKHAKNLQRSKNMDSWTIDDLAAWFTELKMEEYIPYLYSNRVDGALFVNLVEEDFKDMGITNRFHLRKLELILKSYRIRYQRKKEKRQQTKDAPEMEEDEDLLSEYAPSELSAIIGAEDEGGGEYSEDDSNDDESVLSEENEDAKLTEEQRLQKRMDEQNIVMQMIMQGDKENFPIIGDIVRVKYTCTLTDSGRIVMSTKNVLGRPWVEFILGVDQVIKGFDRALPLMCIGERSKITISPEYGYGAKGLPPHIPPNSRLTFDLTLLGLRPRSVWVKPLIQDVTTRERPYFKDMRTTIKMSIESGIIDTPGHIFSASMILNDDPLMKEGGGKNQEQ